MSCDKFKKYEQKPIRKTVVVLFDLSESTRNLRDAYLDSFKKVLPSIGHGDVIVATRITESSITEPKIPIKEALPEFVPKDKMGNPTDNPILVREAKKEADMNLERKKDEFIKIAEEFLFSSKKVRHTDILSSLHIAEKVFKNYSQNKSILVILSDMIEDSSEYNFEKENLTEGRIEEIIKREKRKNRIPELKDVKVYVVSAVLRDTKMFFALQNFWLRYFKECGANLSKENYGPKLIKFDE
jgi:hypothetical protein